MVRRRVLSPGGPASARYGAAPALAPPALRRHPRLRSTCRDPPLARGRSSRSTMTGFVDLHCHTSARSTVSRPASRPGARAGLTHLAVTDHDGSMGRSRRARLAPAGLTVIVGRGDQDRRRRPDRGVPRQAGPARACPRPRPSRRSASRAGSSGIPHPFDRLRGSLLRDARDGGRSPLVDWVEIHNARLVGARQRAGGRVRAASTGSPASPCRTRTPSSRSASRTRRSMATRRRRPGCSRRSPRAEIVPGRASYAVRLVDARSPRPSSARAATGGSGPGVRHEPRGGRARPAGPSTDGWWDRRRPYRPDPMEATPATLDPRAAVTRRCRSRTSRSRASPTPSRCRWRAACASRGRSSRSPSRSSIIARLRDDQRRPARQGARPRSLGADPLLVLRGLPRVLRRLPAARQALGAPAARHGHAHRRPRTRPRSSSCRGWSTASSRPSSVTSTGPTC